MKTITRLALPALFAGVMAFAAGPAVAGSDEVSDPAPGPSASAAVDIAVAPVDLKTTTGAPLSGVQMASTPTCPTGPDCGLPFYFKTDHFLCYNVVSPTTPLNVPVNLFDQFGPTPARVGRPLFLCNPTDKQHGYEWTYRMNPEDHLVCYELLVNQTQFGAVAIFNQFGEQKLGIRDARMLCVPSQKEVIFLRPDRRRPF